MNAELEPLPIARVLRALGLMVASLVTITGAAIAFLHPSLGGSSEAGQAPPIRAYHVAAVDFVSAGEGWVLADQDTGNQTAVFHTENAGMSWTQQLSTPTAAGNKYVRFFDGLAGVFAQIGTRPVLYRTVDGGRTWTSTPALAASATALSWSFVDDEHGWLLADTGNHLSASLYRTENGGWTWTDLGSPVPRGDDAFGVHFSYLTTGWLASAGSSPFAYRTNDFGVTWSRVELPMPPGARTDQGRFFVDVQRTRDAGLIASVVYFPPFNGRTGPGGTIRELPPLPVPFYDGSRPNNYFYSTMIDQVIGGPYSAVQAPLSELLRSVDGGATWVAIQTPALSGTLGYADPSRWMWVDARAWARSLDGGLTWTRPAAARVPSPLPGSLRVVDRDHAWFAASDAPALETTSDGGAHWRLVSLPTPVG